MSSLMVDFIISLDGYGAAEGWPGYWGMEGPEYLAWIEEDAEHEHTALMGATTYRLMSGFAAEMPDDPGLAAIDRDAQGGVLLHLGGTALVGQHRVGRRGPGRGGAGHEAARLATPAHGRQPQPVPVAARSRRGGPLPCGRLPGHHRRHRDRTASSTGIPTSPSTWSTAARSTVGSSCSSTFPRCSMGRLASATERYPRWVMISRRRLTRANVALDRLGPAGTALPRPSADAPLRPRWRGAPDRRESTRG